MKGDRGRGWGEVRKRCPREPALHLRAQRFLFSRLCAQRPYSLRRPYEQQTGSRMGNEASYPAEICSHFDEDEIKRLRKRFKKLDLDSSSALSVKEFTSMPELQGNPLAQRVIDVFDTDGDGQVDFREFILGTQAWKPGSQHAGEKRGGAGLLLGRTERAARAAELQLCAQAR